LHLSLAIARYQVLALVSAFLGWMFDSMDLNLFTLVLFPAVSELINNPNAAEVSRVGGLIMAIKLLAWGVGGGDETRQIACFASAPANAAAALIVAARRWH
jgi:hypothetical protein